MQPDSRIFVAGHRGLVGSAIVRQLQSQGFSHILTASRAQLDLRNRDAVLRYWAEHKPEYLYLAAAKVGGILANNNFPVDFLTENLHIELNLFEAAQTHGTQKVLFLGSSCIYPKFAPQPIREEYLLTGELEPTNEPYAIAKIAGLKMAQAYRRQYGLNSVCLMPTNLYGPNDNFDLASSHVLPALIRKFHEAKQQAAPEVVMWGTGKPRREFLHVDDLAQACLFVMENYNDGEILNVGTGTDIAIADLAEMVARIIGFEGKIVNDLSKPDGTPRKLLDVSRLHALGWQAQIPLEEGIRSTYSWFLQHQA